MDDELEYYVTPAGTKQWRLHGRVHRQGGPALEFVDGTVSWWLYGYYYNTLDEFLERTPISPEDKCMLKLIYG